MKLSGLLFIYTLCLYVRSRLHWYGRRVWSNAGPHTTHATVFTTVGIVAGVFGLVITVVLAIIFAYLW